MISTICGEFRTPTGLAMCCRAAGHDGEHDYIDPESSQEPSAQEGIYRWEQAEGPTERITQCFGRIYIGPDFLSRIGSDLGERIVDLLNQSERDVEKLKEKR